MHRNFNSHPQSVPAVDKNMNEHMTARLGSWVALALSAWGWKKGSVVITAVFGLSGGLEGPPGSAQFRSLHHTVIYDVLQLRRWSEHSTSAPVGRSTGRRRPTPSRLRRRRRRRPTATLSPTEHGALIQRPPLIHRVENRGMRQLKASVKTEKMRVSPLVLMITPVHVDGEFALNPCRRGNHSARSLGSS